MPGLNLAIVKPNRFAATKVESRNKRACSVLAGATQTPRRASVIAAPFSDFGKVQGRRFRLSIMCLAREQASSEA